MLSISNSSLSGIDLAQIVFMTKASTLIAAVLSTFEWVLCLEEEVEFVWIRSWSIGKGLYLFNRYFSIMVLIINAIAFFNIGPASMLTICHPFLIWECIGYYIINIAVIFFCTLREVAVLYERKNISVQWFRIAAVSATLLALFTLTILHVNPQVSNILRNSDYTGCYFHYQDNDTRFFSLLWVPCLISLLVCSMQWGRKWLALKVFSAELNELQMAMAYESYVQGFLGFVAVFCNLILWLTVPFEYSHLVFPFPAALLSIRCGRLALKMRRAYFAVQTTHLSLSLPQFRTPRTEDSHTIV